MKSYVKWGLVMTGITALFILAMHSTGLYRSSEATANPLDLIFIVVVPFVVWTLALRAKKRASKGKLPFKKGIKEGFLISLVYGLTSPFVYIGYYLLLNPQLLQIIKIEYGLGGVSDSTIMAVDGVAQLVSALIGGTVYSAIIMFFLRTNKKK